MKTRILFCGISYKFAIRIRVKTLRENKMIAGETQTNHENHKKVVLKSRTDASAAKSKTEISTSFLQRIISLLKRKN